MPSGGNPLLPGYARVVEASKELISTPGSNPTDEIDEAILCCRPFRSEFDGFVAATAGGRGEISRLLSEAGRLGFVGGGPAGVAEGVNGAGGL